MLSFVRGVVWRQPPQHGLRQHEMRSERVRREQRLNGRLQNARRRDVPQNVRRGMRRSVRRQNGKLWSTLKWRELQRRERGRPLRERLRQRQHALSGSRLKKKDDCSGVGKSKNGSGKHNFGGLP
jgi:phage gpG-like protein